MGFQVVEGGELAFGAQEGVEGDGDLVVVEVAGPVEEVGFDAAFGTFVDGGAAADVGDTGDLGAAGEGGGDRIDAAAGFEVAA